MTDLQACSGEKKVCDTLGKNASGLNRDAGIPANYTRMQFAMFHAKCLGFDNAKQNLTTCGLGLSLFKVLPKTSFTTSMLAHKWHWGWLGGLLDRRHGWTGVGWPILSIHNQLHAV